MKSVIFLFLYLIVFQTVFIESGIILDNIQSGIENTRKNIRCGVRKVGGFLTQRKNVECEEKTQEVNTNELDTGGEPVDKNGGTETKGETTESIETLTTKATTEQNANKTAIVKVPEGKRVISVGANCPPGYRGDGKGNCREEY